MNARRRKQRPAASIKRVANGKWELGIRFMPRGGVPEGEDRPRRRHQYDTEEDAVAAKPEATIRAYGGQEPFPGVAGPSSRDTRTYTVGAGCKLYDRIHVAGKVSPRSRETLTRHRENVETTSLWAMPVESVTLAHLEDDFPEERRAKAKRKAAGISDETIAKDRRHLRSVFRFCKRRGKVTRHVFEEMERSDRDRLMPSWKPEMTKGRVIPADEQTRIVAHLNPRAHRMAAFLGCAAAAGSGIGAGVRKGQAAVLDWAVHFRDFPFPHFAPPTQKKDKQRMIPYESVAEIVGPRKKAGLVFVELGDSPAAIYQKFTACWRYATKQASSTARPHDLRHTFGTILKRRHSKEDTATIMGISAATASTYVDHEKADMTLAAFRELSGAKPKPEAEKEAGR